MAYFQDDLRAICAALPESLKFSADNTFNDVLMRFAEQRPDYWTQPVSHEEAAAFLGKTPNALAMMRKRGEGPGGWTKAAGGYIYPSRLHLANWVAEQIELAKLEPSQRRLAA